MTGSDILNAIGFVLTWISLGSLGFCGLFAWVTDAKFNVYPWIIPSWFWIACAGILTVGRILCLIACVKENGNAK